jgi:hypothetical protein
VNCVKAGGGKFSFQMDRDERRLLFQVLRAYPLVPIAHHRLSKSEEIREDQQLLEESLAAQRKENKNLVKRLLLAKSHFRANKRGWRWSLKESQIEWLLQVLNDVRIGAWLAIGSPDGQMETIAVFNEKTAPYFWAMEVSGHFQAVLLKAIDCGVSPDTE